MSGCPDEDNIFQWKASIAGPKTTPFEVNHKDEMGTQLVSLKTLSFIGRNSVRDLMEGNANCRRLQKLTFKKFAARDYQSLQTEDTVSHVSCFCPAL